MGRPRKNINTEELEINEDIISENDIADKKEKKERKPGAKKVLSETTKAVADTLAASLCYATQNKANPKKNIAYEEAQSITSPIVRMIGRRLPKFLKPLLPKTKLNEQDAADLEEIIVTLAKFSLRFLAVTMEEITMSKEAKQAEKQQKETTNQQAPAPGTPAAPAPAVNRWGTAGLDILATELGFNEVA